MIYLSYFFMVRSRFGKMHSLLCANGWSPVTWYISNKMQIDLVQARTISFTQWLLFAVFALFLDLCFADNNHINVTHITTKDGLSSDSISLRDDVILHDKRGFIWIGTQEGLNRYDGYRFKHYLHAPNDKNSLADNFIQSLHEDSYGYIWIGTKNGLSRYNPLTDQFKTYFPPNKKDGGVITSIYSIFESAPGILWFGSSENGLFRFDTNKNEFQQFIHNESNEHSILGNYVRGVLKDSQGNIWIATRKGLSLYQQEAGFINYPVDIGINIVRLDTQDNFWIASHKGLSYFDKNTRKYKHNVLKEIGPKLNNPRLWSLYFDDQHRLWIGTSSDGVILFNIETNSVKHFSHGEGAESSLNSDNISTLYKDRKGRIWVGTVDRGINVFASSDKYFGFIPTRIKKNDQWKDSPILSTLTDDKGRLWAGSFGGGLFLFDINSKEKINHFYHNENIKHSLPNNYIFSLEQDKEGTIWIGTEQGLSRYNEQSQSFEIVPSPAYITAIKHISGKKLWLATLRKGLAYIDLETDRYVRHEEIKKGSLTFLRSSGNKILWAGSTKGLYNIDNESNSSLHFSHHKDDKNSISHNYITDTVVTNTGDTWVNTGVGLNKFDPITQSFKRIHLDGVSSSTFYNTLVDKKDNLWISTQNSIIRYSPNTHTAMTYRVEDGLPSDTIVLNSAVQSAQGELFFGTPDGILYFDPEDIQHTYQPPKLTFTDFKIFNKSVSISHDEIEDTFTLDKSIYAKTHLDLSYKESFFSFEFAVLHAVKPRRVKYSYKLEGWDKDWISTGADNRIASYTNIPAGNYVLRVRADDTDGFWKNAETSIALNISPPPWKTIWAYILYGLTLVSVVLIYIRTRTNILRHRARVLENIVQQRTAEIENQKLTIEGLLHKKDQLFANVSHEFRTPLTLIMGPITKLLSETEDHEVKKTLQPTLANANRLLRMVDQLLELARLDKTEEKTKHLINASALMPQVVNYFSELINEKKLTLTTSYESDIVLALSPDAFEKITMNLISNAIKYSPDGSKIQIILSTSNAQACIEVKDNGVGISQEDQNKIFERFTRVEKTAESSIPGAGIGLALVKELVDHFNGSIKVHSELDKGSCFSVYFPITHADNNEEISENLHSYSALQEIEYLQHSTAVEPEEQPNENIELPKLLIVEDNPDMRIFIQSSLKTKFHCLLANDGKEGIKIATEEVPDLIITDLMMPNMNGLELTKHIREDIRTSHIPIIMLTAKAGIETRKEAWQTDVDEHIEKPFCADELLLRCENLLNIRKIISQRLSNNVASNIEINNEEEFISARDKRFLENLAAIIEEHYCSNQLCAGFIANHLAMSESQLQRKIKALLNQNIPEYIRNFRLQQSRKLLKGGLSATEVAYAVGFSSSTYFSSCFKAHQGITPKQFQLQHVKKAKSKAQEEA